MGKDKQLEELTAELIKAQEEIKVEDVFKTAETQEEELLTNRPLTLSQSLEEGLNPSEINDERYLEIAENKEKTLEQIYAERIKVGYAQNAIMPINQPIKPAAPEPEFNAYSAMSARKRKKLDNRRADNKKKAEKKGFFGASEDTLAFADETKKYEKNKKKLIGDIDPEAEFASQISADMFAPVPFTSKRDTTLDVQGIRLKIDKIKLVADMMQEKELQRRLDALKRPENDKNNPYKYEPTIEQSVQYAETARITAFRKIGEQMEETLKTLAAANGVNYLTGAPVSKEEQELALKNKFNSIQAFKKLAENRETNEIDEYEKLMSPIFAEWIKKTDENSKADKIPFLFANESIGSEYLKLKKKIDANPESYQAHKDAFDKALKEYIDLQQTMNKTFLLAQSLGFKADYPIEIGSFQDSTPVSERLSEMLMERINDPEKFKTLNARLSALQYAMEYLLTGKEPTDEFANAVLENEFGYTTKKRAKRKKALETKLFALDEVRASFENSSSKLSPLATDYSKPIALAIAEREVTEELMREYYREKESEYKARLKNDENQKTLDVRVPIGLYKKVQINDEGAPATEQDLANYIENKRIIDLFFSENQAERETLFDEILDKFVNIKYNAEMLNPEYMSEHFAELLETSRMILIIDNIKMDSPEFFKQNAARNAKIETLGSYPAYFSTMVAAFASVNGVRVDNVSVKGVFLEEQEEIDMKQNEYENAKSLFSHFLSYESVQMRDFSNYGGLKPKFGGFDKDQLERMRNTAEGIRADNSIGEKVSTVNKSFLKEIETLFIDMEKAGFDYKKANEGAKIFMLDDRLKYFYSPEVLSVGLKLYDKLLNYIDNPEFQKCFSEIYSNTILSPNSKIDEGSTNFETNESKVFSNIFSRGVIPAVYAPKENEEKQAFLLKIRSFQIYSESLLKYADRTEEYPPEMKEILEKYKQVRAKALEVFRKNTPAETLALAQSK